MWGCLTCLAWPRLWTDVTWIFNVFVLHLDWGTAEYMCIFLKQNQTNKQKNHPTHISASPLQVQWSSIIEVAFMLVSDFSQRNPVAFSTRLISLKYIFYWKGKSCTLWRAYVAFSWSCSPVIFKWLIRNKSVLCWGKPTSALSAVTLQHSGSVLSPNEWMK